MTAAQVADSTLTKRYLKDLDKQEDELIAARAAIVASTAEAARIVAETKALLLALAEEAKRAKAAL